MAKIIRNGVVYGSNKASDITFSSDSLYNIESDNVQSAIMTIDEVIGDINELSTTTQSDIVDAINEINTKIGDRASLETVNKTSAVIAINEVLGNLGDKSTLTTTNKGSAIGAINELNQNLVDIVHVTEVTTETVDVPIADADKLGGQLPAYYATKASVDTVNENLGGKLLIEKQFPLGTNDVNITFSIVSGEVYQSDNDYSITIPDGYSFLFGIWSVGWTNSNVAVDFDFYKSTTTTATGKLEITRRNNNQTKFVPCMFCVFAKNH